MNPVDPFTAAADTEPMGLAPEPTVVLPTPLPEPEALAPHLPPPPPAAWCAPPMIINPRGTWLRQLVSPRFLRFCVVGASGVIVNLLVLKLAIVAGVHNNVASALAIEVSILSNFLFNNAWTFRDRRQVRTGFGRLARFHLVSAVGAMGQWVCFVALNLLWLHLLWDASAYHGLAQGWLDQWVVRPITAPPEVGNWALLSQALGIGAALFWNYFANLKWTWSRRESV